MNLVTDIGIDLMVFLTFDLKNSKSVLQLIPFSDFRFFFVFYNVVAFSYFSLIIERSLYCVYEKNNKFSVI